MIKEKHSIVKIGSWNHSHYKELGYHDVKKGTSILVGTNHLTKSSHTIVTAICDYCGGEYSMLYKTYNKRIEKTGKYSCKKCCYDVMRKSLKQKYGVENVSFIPTVKDKIRKKSLASFKERKIKRTKTNNERYGVDNTFQSSILMKDSLDKVKKANIKNGRWVSDDKLGDWQLYKKNVMRLSRKNKKIILKGWDGVDYYDGEYIKDNLKLHFYNPNYPTLDHKISIRYGFDNNISIEDLSDINNLCITKKFLNTRKYTKNEIDFST